MKRAIDFLLIVAIAGCASTSAAESDMQTLTDICQIMNSEELYLSKTVRLTARFNTDLRHYTFLQDDSCGDKNLLNIGRVRGNEEYEKLRKSWLAVCEERGSAGLCVIEEPVDVVGTVRRSDQGNLVLDVVSIKNDKGATTISPPGQ